MPLPMTKGEFNRLGDRLIAHERPAESDLAQLRAVLAVYQEVLGQVKVHLRDLGVHAVDSERKRRGSVIFVWNYLVIYNRRAGEIVRHRRFQAPADALAARFEAEHEFCEDPDVEVVVLGADSWDALYRTHARYFKRVQELAGTALERESRSS